MIPASFIFDEPQGGLFAERGLGTNIFSFLVIGVASALVFVLASQALISLVAGVPDWIISAVCYAACVLPAYAAHRRFSFRSRAPHRQALPRYVSVQAFSVFLAAVFSYLAYGTFGLPSPVAAVLVITLTSVVNFVVLRIWAFRDSDLRLGS